MKVALPSFSDLVKKAWNIYKRNFVFFIKLNLYTAFVSFLVGVVVVLGGIVSTFFLQSVPLLTKVIIGVPVAVVVLTLLGSYISLAVAKAISCVSTGETLSPIRSYFSSIKPLVLVYVLVSIINSFLVFGGITFFIVPGFLFSIWFMFAVYTFLEGHRGFSALFASREYIKGNTLGVFWRTAAFGLVAYIVLAIFEYITEKIGIETLGSIVSGVVNWMVVGPLSMLFLYQIYIALKKEKGEITVDSSLSRKLKYVAISLFGIILSATVAGVIFSQYLLPAIKNYTGLYIGRNSTDLETNIQTSEPQVLYSRQLSQARDTQRRSDLLIITNAVYQYAAENNGELPPDHLSFPTEPTCIGTAPECFDLASQGIVPTYIQEMPMDPQNGSEENTGYTIYLKPTGRIEAASISEINPSEGISIER